MELKIILGVFLPIAIISLLVSLSVANIGLSVQKAVVSSVSKNQLFVSQDSQRTGIQIMTMTLSNDFFMPSKYELPRLIACLNDRENLKAGQQLQLRYSEGIDERNVPVYGDLFLDYNAVSRQGVELSSNSKKDVKILLDPLTLYNYDQEIESYMPYDAILLLELKNNHQYYYNLCENLNSDELSAAVSIQISN